MRIFFYKIYRINKYSNNINDSNKNSSNNNNNVEIFYKKCKMGTNKLKY